MFEGKQDAEPACLRHGALPGTVDGVQRHVMNGQSEMGATSEPGQEKVGIKDRLPASRVTACDLTSVLMRIHNVAPFRSYPVCALWEVQEKRSLKWCRRLRSLQWRSNLHRIQMLWVIQSIPSFTPLQVSSLEVFATDILVMISVLAALPCTLMPRKIANI